MDPKNEMLTSQLPVRSDSAATDLSDLDGLEPPSAALRFWSHVQTDISPKHADIPVIICCFVSGLCDSATYNAWTCFVSMQTGNTIFLALGASDQPAGHPYGWAKSLLSIVCFLMGCFAFASTRHLGAKRRGTLALSFFMQSLCILIAGCLVQANVVPERGGVATKDGNPHFIEMLPIALLAFQSGGQIVTSRLLGYNEIPTTVLTSVYCDLASDPMLLAGLSQNVKRNRRLASVVLVLVGGLAGGWISRSSAGMATVLWLGGLIKMSIAISWSQWKGI